MSFGVAVHYPAIDVTLVLKNDWFMNYKLIYWIPIVGMIVSIVNYDKENGMSASWAYYQAAVLVVSIWIIAYIQSSH